jgi:hypothetical protein
MLALTAISTAVCGGPTCCLVTPVVMDTPYSVVNYGNASAGVFDWLGAARDFYPAYTTLASTAALNCSQNVAFLLNGTDVLSQQPWAQLAPSTCSVNISALGDGDFTLVAAVFTPNASLTMSQPDPAAPVPTIMFSGSTAALALVSGPNCALPASFEYCGTNFSAISCSADGTLYGGECAADEGTPPTGCHGNPLFQLAAALTSSCGTICQIIVALAAAALATVFFIGGATVYDGDWRQPTPTPPDRKPPIVGSTSGFKRRSL